MEHSLQILSLANASLMTTIITFRKTKFIINMSTGIYSVSKRAQKVKRSNVLEVL